MFDYQTDTKVLLWVLKRYSRYIDVTEEDAQQIIASGLLPMIVSSLAHNQDQVRVAALEIIDNLFWLVDDYDVVQLLLNCDILYHYESLLSHPNKTIRKLAMKVLPSMCNGKPKQIQAVINTGTLDKVVEMMLRNDDLATHDEAVETISQFAASASPGQLLKLIELGAIPPLFEELGSRRTSSNYILLIDICSMLKNSGIFTEKIKRAIEQCGGLAVIVNYTDHGDDFEMEIANEIIAKFFPSALDKTK